MYCIFFAIETPIGKDDVQIVSPCLPCRSKRHHRGNAFSKGDNDRSDFSPTLNADAIDRNYPKTISIVHHAVSQCWIPAVSARRCNLNKLKLIPSFGSWTQTMLYRLGLNSCSIEDSPLFLKHNRLRRAIFDGTVL